MDGNPPVRSRELPLSGGWDSVRAQAAQAAFCIRAGELAQTAASFRFDIEQGLKNKDVSSLRMLPSYTALPDGGEKGDFLALDFGGTNVRVQRIRLLGGGKWEILKKAAAPLRCAVYDFTSQDTPREELFDFLAGLVDSAMDGDTKTPCRLGHTFSFPSEQDSLKDAKLIIWTKEFAVPGVEGEYVNALLSEALVRHGFANVKPVAVVNDTVAVLLAAAYCMSPVFIGSIYATGHNVCYLESFEGKQPKMILNMESGGFSKLIPNEYDNALDARSEKPGEQRMEKMTSGRYLGELYALALEYCLGREKGTVPVFSAAELSGILSDGAENILHFHGIDGLSKEEYEEAEALAEAVLRRSARLVAAEFAGTLWHLAGSGMILPQSIAVDGSVYEKIPFLQAALHDALVELLGSDSRKITVACVKDGSALGAAIAACISE